MRKEAYGRNEHPPVKHNHLDSLAHTNHTHSLTRPLPVTRTSPRTTKDLRGQVPAGKWKRDHLLRAQKDSKHQRLRTKSCTRSSQACIIRPIPTIPSDTVVRKSRGAFVTVLTAWNK